jgi:hypothetical protein
MAVRSGISISFTALPTRYRGVRTSGLVSDMTQYTKDFAEDVMNWVREYPGLSGGAHRKTRARRGMKKLRGSGLIGGEYQRTDRLYNAWRAIPTSSGNRISYELQNMVTDPTRHGRFYARLVHGGPDGSGQWWFHAQTGWRRLDEAVYKYGGRDGFKEGAGYILEDHLATLGEGGG